MLAIFRKIIAFFMSVLAFLGLGSKPAPSEISLADINAGVVKETDEGSLRLEGGSLIIELRGNPTTGYSWTHSEEGGSLSFRGEEYKQDPAAPNVGGVGGTYVFTYELSEPGASTLTFIYLRPWEADPDPLTVIVDITVSEDLKIESLGYVHG